ncbi:MAG: ABC transporter ATP-binding protein, partial [Bacilli bacterium]
MSRQAAVMPGNKLKSFDKPKDFNGTIKKLLKYVSSYKIAIISVIIFAVCSTVFAVVGPKILGNATTELFNGLVSKVSGGSGINFGKIGNILLSLLVLYIISACFSYVQGFIMTGVSQKITYNLRKEISEKIGKLPIKFFDSRTNGETLSIITNDVDTLSQSLNQTATQLITSVITIIGIFIMMLSINVPMTLIAVVILPLSSIFIMIVVKKSQKYFKNVQNYLSNVNGKVEEMYSGHNVVKVFNAEDKVLKSFELENNKLYNSAWKSQFLSGLMQPIMAFVGNLGYVFVAITGGYLAIKGKITVGNIQSFIQYTRQFTQPISQLAQVSNMLQSMVAAAERVFNFLGEKEEKIIIKSPVPTDNIKGSVEFKNVSFGYNKDKMIIRNFNAKVKKGQKIAIVG